MRAKLTKEELEGIEKYVEKNDKEALAKLAELVGGWKIEDVKTKPEFEKYERRPAMAGRPITVDCGTVTIDTADIATMTSVSRMEDILSEFQRIYDSWDIVPPLTSSLLTTERFEQIPSLIIKDTLETLIATDIKDKIKYYVDESPVLDTTSIYPWYHFFKIAIDGYREKVRKFHLSTDRIQSLYQQTVRVPKEDVEKMFNYIFIDVAEDLAEFQYKSDQFFFAIWDQLPYFASESSKYKKPYRALWEGIREDMERHIKGEDDPASLEASRALDDEDGSAESAWRRAYASKW